MIISTLLIAETTANIPWWFWGLLVGTFSLLVSIIGFLIKFIIENQKEAKEEQKQTNNKLFDLIGKLEKSLSSLDKTMGAVQQHNEDFEKVYDNHIEECRCKFADIKKK